MDAIMFLKEWKRMCKTMPDCDIDCPFGGKFSSRVDCELDIQNKPEKAVEILEHWSKENPMKTIMDDFFEKFPNAPKDDGGEPITCPYDCGYVTTRECPEHYICVECWSRPLEVSK